MEIRGICLPAAQPRVWALMSVWNCWLPCGVCVATGGTTDITRCWFSVVFPCVCRHMMSAVSHCIFGLRCSVSTENMEEIFFFFNESIKPCINVVTLFLNRSASTSKWSLGYPTGAQAIVSSVSMETSFELMMDNGLHTGPIWVERSPLGTSPVPSFIMPIYSLCIVILVTHVGFNKHPITIPVEAT